MHWALSLKVKMLPKKLKNFKQTFFPEQNSKNRKRVPYCHKVVVIENLL